MRLLLQIDHRNQTIMPERFQVWRDDFIRRKSKRRDIKLAASRRVCLAIIRISRFVQACLWLWVWLQASPWLPWLSSPAFSSFCSLHPSFFAAFGLAFLLPL